MKKCLRGVVGLILSCFLVLPYQVTYAAAALNAAGIPTEVANNTYVEIPVYQDGEEVSMLSQYMEKSEEYKGYANIEVRAFAYQTGTQVKIGVLISYYDEDGNRRDEFFDGVGVDDPETINWPECKGLSVSKNGDFTFSGPNDNEKRILIPFITSTGQQFSRYTEKAVLLNAAYDTIKLSTLSAGTTIVDTYKPILRPSNTCANKKLFTSPLMLEENSLIQVDLNMQTSDKSKEPMYQLISVENMDTVPTFPVTSGTWTKLGESGEVKYNEKELYKDYDPEGGKISVQHYMFTGSQKQAPQEIAGTGYQHPRAEVFQYPVNDVVKQSTDLDGNTKYSTQQGEKAFFNTQNITDTTLEATFVPKQDGTYYFAVESNEYAYGTIEINGKKEKFVEDNSGWRRKYRTNGKGYSLKAGNLYKINLRTKYTNSNYLAPRFVYSLDSKNNWQLITPDLLTNQNPTNACSRAAKLWGFIEPDVSGTFNFGLRADDGAYGYINVKGENVVFVDNFGISATTDQSNSKAIYLEKGKVYPIYIEWYEGCPVEAALAPRYKEIDDTSWKDIPANWFHPSNSKTVAIYSEAMYEPTIVSAGVPVPEEGINYLALKVTDKDGTEHQVLYGPFQVGIGEKVDEVPPQQDDDGNYIVPTSVSNFNATITYGVDAKAIKYTIDLKEILNTKLDNGAPCFGEVLLDQATVQLVCRDAVMGDTTEMITVGDSNPSGDYSVTLKENADGVKSVIEIVANNPEILVSKGSSHTINIYFEVNFEDDIPYGSTSNKVAPSGTYLEVVNREKHKYAQLTISRQEKVREEIMLAVGLKPAEYELKETTETVPMQLRGIPQIY